MALVSHTIVSRYTPQRREPVAQPGTSKDDPWQTETSFGQAQRRHERRAPYFVAAALEYDEYGMPMSNVNRSDQLKSRSAVEDVSAWYRSLTDKHISEEEENGVRQGQPSLSVSSSGLSPRHETTESRHVPTRARVYDISPPREKPSWFTSSLGPSAGASCSTFAQHTSKPSAFVDLLSRDPPPLPSEPAFKPPVFLTLGPGNKGFTMLQRKGWQEGEGLGSTRVERIPRRGLGVRKTTRGPRAEILGRPVALEPMSTINNAQQGVIDLTISDSDSNEEHKGVDLTPDSPFEWYQEPEGKSEPLPSLEHRSSDTQPHGTTLLTPIPTTLKADRLGIGLKAARRLSTTKTKAVTHTPFALAAHIRRGNQMRKEKARHGRGSRGFTKKSREEGRERVGMLAYMNS